MSYKCTRGRLGKEKQSANSKHKSKKFRVCCWSFVTHPGEKIREKEKKTLGGKLKKS